MKSNSRIDPPWNAIPRWVHMMLIGIGLARMPVRAQPADFCVNVRQFGATGNGRTLDTAAINKAIEAVDAAGGGTVLFPAGIYLSGSIHLRSNLVLRLGAGATIVGAPNGIGAYDRAEPNAAARYDDFGHTHWHNSLIWGENLSNVEILGPGTINGGGMTRSNKMANGDGDKILALKLCRNVILRDVTLAHGGHFAILATGVDNLTIDNLMIDTDRDGMDLDACRNVRVSNCSVNSPRDDGICLKSSYSLGFLRPTEYVTIANCCVSGYTEGTMLDGTRRGGGGTGRIKLGTESNGGFEDIAITNCVFDHCRGLALETVDGGDLEDIVVSNLLMRAVSNSPIFIRLGGRANGPNRPPPGHLSRVFISDVVVTGASTPLASIIAGIPGHEIQDVRLSNIRVETNGGGTSGQARIEPPEAISAYPEPYKMGTMPAYGFYCRHVNGLEFERIAVEFEQDDFRPAFVVEQSRHVTFDRVQARRARVNGVSVAVRESVDITAQASPGLLVK